MADGDVQPVRIIVGDGLPVEVARAQRHPADRAQLLEPIGRDLGLIRRHHLCHRRRARLQRHEQKTAPVLDRQRYKPKILGSEARIFLTVRDPDQPPVPRIAPRVIGAGQHLRAAPAAVDQPGAAVAAHIGEGAYLAVVTADHDHALAKIVERAPFARFGDLALVTHHLRRGAKKCGLLRFEKLGVAIEPSRQAHAVEGIGRQTDGFQLGCHAPALPFRAFCGNGAGDGVRAGLAPQCFSLSPNRAKIERQPEGRPHWAASAIGQ